MLDKIRKHSLYIPVLWTCFFVACICLVNWYVRYLPTLGPIVKPMAESSAAIIKSVYKIQSNIE